MPRRSHHGALADISLPSIDDTAENHHADSRRTH
jgi:hypothetical protein